MSNISSDETKKILTEQWEEWCSTFTNGDWGFLWRS